jgi:hypothetical protein
VQPAILDKREGEEKKTNVVGRNQPTLEQLECGGNCSNGTPDHKGLVVATVTKLDRSLFPVLLY